MVSRISRTLVLLLSATALVIAVAGCGTSSASSGNKSNSVINIVCSPKGSWTSNFNPFAGGVNCGAQGMIYETLLFFNREDGSVKPWLASKYSWNSDGTTVTFNLQQGVKWSDGQAFTSNDVVFTLNLLHRYPALDSGALWQAITNVANPDANTVTVTFAKPAGPLLWYLAGQTYIVPQHLWSSVDPTTYTNDKPVGTGPFVLKSFSPQLYVLDKNTSYWQAGKPAISEIRYPAYTSNTSADLLLSSGQVDWTGLFTPNIDKTFVQRDSAHNHYWFPPANVVMLYVNTAKAPYNQVAVRQALSAAIDRTDISNTAESTYEPVASPTALVLPANKQFLSSDYANTTFGAADPAKADQLLQSAGFTKGSDGIYASANGKKLSFQINVVTGWTDWVTACQIMAKNFQAAGIDATVNALSFNQYFSALQQGSFDTAISWTNAGPTPYYLYASLLLGANSAPIGKQAASNFERWTDPATDTLLNQYANTTDQATQQQAIYGIEKIMVEQMPSIPLVEGATWYEYSTTHVTGWPDQSNPYAMPSPYTAPDNEIVVLNLKPA
ncbi:MAG TPA: ABC transporter substrate-binding protein [Ktedonobacterales bacterium]|nr:ABC transporter substrate-binding protein [Ktedonobacterales bacterium]